VAGKERRRTPRRRCALALRFRIAVTLNRPRTEAAPAGDDTPVQESMGPYPTLEGESVNISERGIYFVAREKPSVGTPLEIYLTLPRELTGREPEPVRCRARVAHVEEQADHRGLRSIGAAIERFESLARESDWTFPTFSAQI
jgi:hypothetical protein